MRNNNKSHFEPTGKIIYFHIIQLAKKCMNGGQLTKKMVILKIFH